VSDAARPLSPGITVLEITHRRPLQLPKFPYRSLNLEAVQKKFGELEVGASFFYNMAIAMYKVSSDTALSTTTGIFYVVNREISIKEMMFPEVGEIFNSSSEVKTAVISGSTANSTCPYFFYAPEDSSASVSTAVLHENKWRDDSCNFIQTVSVPRKTFIL
jgi:hypothetical protein